MRPASRVLSVGRGCSRTLGCGPRDQERPSLIFCPDMRMGARRCSGGPPLAFVREGDSSSVARGASSRDSSPNGSPGSGAVVLDALDELPGTGVDLHAEPDLAVVRSLA